MRLKISVTAEDIRKGKRGNARSCPISRAVRRKSHCAVITTDYSIQIRRGTKFKIFLVPKRAKEFVIRFDHGRAVKPFTFSAKEL